MLKGRNQNIIMLVAVAVLIFLLFNLNSKSSYTITEREYAPFDHTILSACDLSKGLAWTLPRLFLVYDHTIFHFFEDWVNPLLYALGMTLDVIKFSVLPDRRIRTDTLQKSLKQGDTVLLLQRTHGLTQVAGVEYWFLNTEGPDKSFAEKAISQGFKRIIDYSTFNTYRHARAGAESSLWLPIINSHVITFHNVRDKLCMVGGAGAKGIAVLHHLPIFRQFFHLHEIPQVPSFQAHSPVKTVFRQNPKNARKSQNTPSTNSYQNETQFPLSSLKNATSGHARTPKSVLCPPVISVTKFRRGTVGLSNGGGGYSWVKLSRL